MDSARAVRPPRRRWTAAEVLEHLPTSGISSARIETLGLGNVGITFNVHLLLGPDGEWSGWLAKRLRSACFADPDATFARFRREHELVEAHFRRFPEGPEVPPTCFTVVDRSLGPDRDTLAGRELVLLQEYVTGVTLSAAAERFGRDVPAWLRARLQGLVRSYSALQASGTVPDLFLLTSDHLKVDEPGERLVLIDTNNLVAIDTELAGNSLFRGYDSQRHVSVATLHQVKDRICADHGVDERRCSCDDRAVNLTELRTILDLCRYFPLPPTPNAYLAKVIQAFGLT